MAAVPESIDIMELMSINCNEERNTTLKENSEDATLAQNAEKITTTTYSAMLKLEGRRVVIVHNCLPVYNLQSLMSRRVMQGEENSRKLYICVCILLIFNISLFGFVLRGSHISCNCSTQIARMFVQFFPYLTREFYQLPTATLSLHLHCI